MPCQPLTEGRPSRKCPRVAFYLEVVYIKIMTSKHRQWLRGLSRVVAVSAAALICLGSQLDRNPSPSASAEDSASSPSSKQAASSPEKALRAITVKLKADGVTRRVRTTARTVGEFLGQQGLPVGNLDRVSPSCNSLLGPGMTVKIIRVTQRVLEKAVTLPFKTTVEFSQSLRPGIQRVIQEGREGSSICLYRLWMADGKVERKDLIDTRRVQKPINRVVAMGDRSFGPSRGGLGARKVVWMEATGYSPDPRSCGKYATGITSIGLHAGYGVVAVDPRVIPLGSRLYIEGYGYAVAADVGGAIKGLRIDLGHDTHGTALAVGRRQVKVHVLD